MRGVVLTVDQRSSRTTPDLVPETLAALSAWPATLGFERTAGDEIQALLSDPPSVPGCLSTLLRAGAWTIGVGVGEIEEPLPSSTRAARGPAYHHARTAVARAAQSPARLSVVGDDDYRAEQLETVLWLWAEMLARRTSRGWEVSDLLAEGLTHAEAASRLGISQSAVSQRARAAAVVEGVRAERLVAQLVAEMIG